MTEPAAHQPDQDYCPTEEDRDGTWYICTQKAGHPRDHKMIKRADMSAARRSAYAARTVTGLAEIDTTQPLDERGTPVTHIDEARRMAVATDRAVKLARNAEHNRFAAAFSAEVGVTGFLIELLIEAGEQHNDHELAHPATILKIRNHVEGWVMQRALNSAEGGGS